MGTTQLLLYNSALDLCEDRSIASLSENAPRRRYLDSAWNNGAAWRACLEQSGFSFALRTVMLDADTAMEPDFGFTKVFAAPTDCIRLNMISADERFDNLLTQYSLEAGFFYADVDPLFLSYVSSDAAYGGDLSKWPEAFSAYVAAYLASKIVGKLTTSRTLKAEVFEILEKAKRVAMGNDSLNKPARAIRSGGWAKARLSRSSGGAQGNGY